MSLLTATAALAAMIELLTCWFRFGLDLQSTRDTAWVARFTFGLRVHHGYVGAGLILLHPLGSPGPTQTMLLSVGAAMVISDLVHHYLVLWPIVGRPQFHLVYPGSALARWRDARRAG